MSISYLFTNKQLRAEVARLNTEHAKLLGEFKSADEALAAHNDFAAKAESTISDLTAKLEAAESAKAAALQTQTDFDAKVATAAAAKAREIAAGQGVPTIAIAPSSAAPGSKSATMTRAEFNQLSPAEQSKFCLSGGRISETK